MRHSIRTRFTLLIFSMLVALVLAVCCLNTWETHTSQAGLYRWRGVLYLLPSIALPVNSSTIKI